ncbi:toMV resistant protein Tm-2 netted virescent-like [Rhododendron vialii]|uniref:toMV resistant protein Tm-2 netted virescent-like n=1 Tax=Rhododendron vialii TaxID=182163 RepID=UPI0026603558|nr:toMV resistant protein Tm-2 netted virescent-like [Rhododendron vialii]
MAEAAILGVIAKISGEIAVNRIIKESSRLSRVREDLIWIETEMRRIQSYLEDAEAKQFRTKGVSNFIREIQDLAYDVEDIIDTYFAKISLMSRTRWKRLLDFRNMRIAHGFVKEVEGIRKRVEDIKNSRQTFGIDECSRSCEEDTRDPRQSFPHLDEPNVVGFDDLIKILVHKVLDEDSHHRVVSIVGFPGLGKTTLARKVYNSAWQSKVYNSHRQRFDCAAWICVSERPNEKGLLRDIAGQVGLEKEKMEHNVETNLYEFLSRKRYVIVIDDIWHTRAWDALKIGLPTNSENGSRIVLTSRHTDVGVHVGGPNSVLKLEPLNQETSRRLFYKLIVGDLQNICQTQDPPQLEKIGEQILEKCGGVPLAIVLAAGLLKLRERSETAWKGVLEDMGQDNDQCAEIFALSYNDLPLNLKPCFLYFGIFPEDREVEAFDLINLWAAEGFIRGNRVREVEEVGDDYLNHLIARNLIQVVERRYNGRVRSVRIHDILHNLCIRVANEINFFNIHRDEINCNTTLKLRRVAIHCSDTDHYPALYPKTSSLRAMFCFDRQYPWNSKAHKNLLGDSKFLRVLSVEKGNDVPRSLLTKITNLRQLTYLKLRSPIMVVELPFAISNLKSLLTLDLRELWGVYLPNVIWSMKQLRHLLLPNFGYVPSLCRVNFDVSHPVEISLSNLQTLQGLPGDHFKADWLHKITNLRTLRVNRVNKDIIGVLSHGAPVSHKLEELFLVSGVLPLLETASLNLVRYDNLFELRILDVKLNDLSHDKLPPNLTKLTLSGTRLRKNPTEALKKLQKLKFLELLSYSFLGKVLVFSGEPGYFPQLEVLKIKDLPNLERVVVKEEGLPRLRDFMILDCSAETLLPDRVRNAMRTN